MHPDRGRVAHRRVCRAATALFVVTVLLFLARLTDNHGSPPEVAGGVGSAGPSCCHITPKIAQRLRWGLKAVRAPEAWEVTQGDDTVVVAVIDSGIDYTVPYLADRIWVNHDEILGNGIDDDRNGYVDDIHGWDFRDGDPDSLKGSPLNWHGTFVAGLIASAVDISTGVGGVAPEVRLMDLRVLDSRGLFYRSDWNKIARAINYAVDNGARIINLSIYTRETPPPAVKWAIRRALRRGVLVVTVAGNQGKDGVCPFGEIPGVVTVGAVDRDLKPASFSNRGPEVDFAAPGVQVISVIPHGASTVSSGTSFATAHVSGVAALLLSVEKHLSLDGIFEILALTSVDVADPGKDAFTGFGLVNAESAIKALTRGSG